MDIFVKLKNEYKMADIFETFDCIEIPPTDEDRKNDKFDFWERFTKVEAGGLDAVKTKFNEIMEECKGDHIKITELYVICNHKCWDHSKTNIALSNLYHELQCTVYMTVDKTFTQEQICYFYDITD